MSRLRHSPAGYVRSLQISRHRLFALVEGTEVDPFFFGEVCRRVCQPRTISYRVSPARELPLGSGGKAALVSFYRYARSRSRLLSTLGGKPTVLVFFLDKDVDDLRRTRCRSPHVIYTAYYDVQNHVFREADFARAVSSAASIDVTELLEHPTFRGDWHESAARRWKEWIALCLLRLLEGVPGPNYGVVSNVNVPLNGLADPTLVDAAVEAARVHLGLSPDQMQRKMKAILQRVERHLAGGTFDCVFKGKWYATILESDLRTAFAGRPFRLNGVSNRASSAMAATLDFSRPWADHFVLPLVALIAMI